MGESLSVRGAFSSIRNNLSLIAGCSKFKVQKVQLYLFGKLQGIKNFTSCFLTPLSTAPK
jgi:hypothetical protein